MKRCTFGSIYVIESNNKVVVRTPHFATTSSEDPPSKPSVRSYYKRCSAKRENGQRAEDPATVEILHVAENKSESEEEVPPDEMLALLYSDTTTTLPNSDIRG